jgi:hypothetical protein
MTKGQNLKEVHGIKHLKRHYHDIPIELNYVHLLSLNIKNQ